MLTEQRLILLLRIVLAGFFLVLIPFELFSLPGQWAHEAKTHPENADLRWPLTAITVFFVVCVQAVIVCTWKLLTMVQRDRIFTEASLVWVDVIIGAMAAAWAIVAGFLVWIGLHADDPGPIVVFFLLTSGLTVAVLLMGVMRTLLKRATALRTDMEAVI
jgi:hypothetical protein